MHSISCILHAEREVSELRAGDGPVKTLINKEKLHKKRPFFSLEGQFSTPKQRFKSSWCKKKQSRCATLLWDCAAIEALFCLDV
jgi:hypothetical protein